MGRISERRDYRYAAFYSTGTGGNNGDYKPVCRKSPYKLMTLGKCPQRRRVSMNECLEAAQYVGASFTKFQLDGTRRSFSRGSRPAGCTLNYSTGEVQWWGSRYSAECGHLGYDCVCKRR